MSSKLPTSHYDIKKEIKDKISFLTDEEKKYIKDLENENQRLKNHLKFLENELYSNKYEITDVNIKNTT